MFRLTRTRHLPIGLDLGRDSVRMIQLRVEQNEVSVAAAASHPVPEEARGDVQTRLGVSMEIVRAMLAAEGFVGREVVACLPRETVQYKNIRLPLMPDAELAAAIEFEARNSLSGDPGQTLVRHLPAGEVRAGNESRQEVILVSAGTDEVDLFVEQLARSGAVPVSLDIEPCAIYRGIERFIRRREDEQEVHVIVELGSRRANVVIGRGRALSFYKTIEIGGKQLHEAVAAKLGITTAEAEALRARLAAEPSEDDGRRDPVAQAVYDATRPIAEELAREVSLCLRYYSVTFRGARPARVRLAGGGAGDPTLRSQLAAMLSVPVEPMRPLQSVDASRLAARERMGECGQWAVAFGLALRLAKGPFGALDGKPREAALPRGQSVNLEQAVAAMAAPARPTVGVVAHA